MRPRTDGPANQDRIETFGRRLLNLHLSPDPEHFCGSGRDFLLRALVHGLDGEGPHADAGELNAVDGDRLRGGVLDLDLEDGGEPIRELCSRLRNFTGRKAIFGLSPAPLLLLLAQATARLRVRAQRFSACALMYAHSRDMSADRNTLEQPKWHLSAREVFLIFAFWTSLAALTVLNRL